MPSDDPWLLPSRQAEHPARSAVADVRLHGRREATFLILATIFLVATTMSPIFGISPAIDLIALLGLRDAGLPAAVLPFGVLAYPLGFLAVNLVGELYGLRRATALVVAGLIASLAVTGLVRVADAAGQRPVAFGAALAFASCYVVAHVSNVMLFAAVSRRSRGRRLWLRANIATLIAQLGGWAAFAFVMYGYAVGVNNEVAPAAIDATSALLVGASVYAVACALVLTPPFVAIAHALSIYLRVGHWMARDDDYEDDVPVRRSQPAFVRATPPPPPQPQPQPQAQPQPQPQDKSHPRASRQEIRPYTSAEMRFFSEGDVISEEAAESAS